MIGAPAEALLPAVFAASLVGSLHCAGMCGPLMAFVAGGESSGSRLGVQGVYHGARLVGYVALGVAAGFTGGLVELTAPLANLGSVAALAAALTLAITGVLLLLRELGVRVPGLRQPRALESLGRSMRTRATRMRGLPRAATIGGATALLPCGWLYAFVALAAGTASATSGALVMAAFWAGTVPALALVGFGVQGISRVLGARLRVALSVGLIGLGALALFDRSQLDVTRLADRVATQPGEAAPCCHAAEASGDRGR